MFATLYTIAVDAPLYESAWWLAVLWLLRSLCLFGMFPRCLCCGCTCQYCNPESPVSCEIQVTIAGLVDIVCLNCSNLHRTYVLELRADQSDTDCCWSYDLSGAEQACLSFAIWLLPNSAQTEATVILGINSDTKCTTTGDLLWRKTGYSDNIPCDSWSAESFPYVSGGIQCSGASSTCTVTSL
jgi:hypothetical protein